MDSRYSPVAWKSNVWRVLPWHTVSIVTLAFFGTGRARLRLSYKKSRKRGGAFVSTTVNSTKPSEVHEDALVRSAFNFSSAIHVPARAMRTAVVSAANMPDDVVKTESLHDVVNGER